jgi:hypothetical protein
VYVIDFYLPSRKLEERGAELLQLQTKLKSLLISPEDKTARSASSSYNQASNGYSSKSCGHTYQS